MLLVLLQLKDFGGAEGREFLFPWTENFTPVNSIMYTSALGHFEGEKKKKFTIF